MQFDWIPFFYAWVVWCACTYGAEHVFNGVFDFWEAFSGVMYGQGWVYDTMHSDEDSDEDSDSDSGASDDDFLPELVAVPFTPNYTDKYKDALAKMPKEWVFTPEEQARKADIMKTHVECAKQALYDSIMEARQAIEDIHVEQEEDDDAVNYDCGDDDNDIYEDMTDATPEERTKERNERIAKWNTQIVEWERALLQEREFVDEADEFATQVLVKERLDRLKTSMVMEKTPNGNVLMMYDGDSETFVYYSDVVVPYRYLEVVARKYVKTFDVRPLFIEMDEELKLFEAKWTKEYEIKRQQEEEAKAKQTKTQEMKKKSVFAKFKDYNVEGKSGKVNSAPPPKNNLRPRTIQETKADEKLWLKERANKYSNRGKLANFGFLQKVERKVFDKKLGLSFADFKKMQQQQKQQK